MDETEALRRRLYRPGATEADRARFAQRATGAPTSAVLPRRPRVPRVLVGVVAVAAVAGLAVTGLMVFGRSLAAPAPSAVQLQAAPVAVAAPVAPTIVPTQRVPVSVDGRATTGQRVEGRGTADVSVDLSAASFDGGRFTVLLAPVDARSLGWSAHSLEARRDWSFVRRTVATGAVRDRLGATLPEVVDYSGSPPRWITVQAPVDARWTLTVAFAPAAH